MPIDRRTRNPSRTVRRFVVPEMRIDSKLGTSAMLQPGAHGADVDDGLDLEPAERAVEHRQHVAPEGGVAVAEVGEPGAEAQAHEAGQRPVAQSAVQLHVVGAAARA